MWIWEMRHASSVQGLCRTSLWHFAPMYPAPDMQTAAEYISQGRQARHEKRLADARAHYTEAAHIYREQNNQLAYAHTIRHIADMHLDESDLGAAKPLY